MNKNVPPENETYIYFFLYFSDFSHFTFIYRRDALRRSRDFDKEDERGVIFSRDSWLYIYIHIHTYGNKSPVEIKSSHVKSRVYWKVISLESILHAENEANGGKNGRSIASYDLAKWMASALDTFPSPLLARYLYGRKEFVLSSRNF